MYPPGTIIEHFRDINPTTNKPYQAEILSTKTGRYPDEAIQLLDSPAHPYYVSQRSLELYWKPIGEVEPED